MLTENQFERFRGFLELVSRFEFEFRRCENKIFSNDSNFWCVQSSITHTKWPYMCLCCCLFVPTKFQFECCCVRDAQVASQDTPPQVTDCAGDSRLNLCHKTTFHNFSFYFLKQFGTGKPCVICQDKTRLVEFPLREGIGARCVLAAGGRSLV